MTRRLLPAAAALLIVPNLSGCLAKAAWDVATLPVKVTSKAVDMATTSQSEADEKRGRALRKEEERRGKLDREWRKQTERCQRGDQDACARATAVQAEIDRVDPPR